MTEQTDPPEEETPVDPDDPSQQSTERERVEQERKLSSPEEAEGGLRGTGEEGDPEGEFRGDDEEKGQARE